MGQRAAQGEGDPLYLQWSSQGRCVKCRQGKMLVVSTLTFAWDDSKSKKWDDSIYDFI